MGHPWQTGRQWVQKEKVGKNTRHCFIGKLQAAVQAGDTDTHTQKATAKVALKACVHMATPGREQPLGPEHEACVRLA